MEDFHMLSNILKSYIASLPQNQNKMYIFKTGNGIEGTNISPAATADINDGIAVIDL